VPRKIKTPAVINNAPQSTIVIRLRAAWLSRFKNDKRASVIMVAGTLPVASLHTTCHSTLRANPCTRLPAVLVAAA